jgi:hypothetical protein
MVTRGEVERRIAASTSEAVPNNRLHAVGTAAELAAIHVDEVSHDVSP